MITSRDEIDTFIPTKKPKLVILGTMASIKARDVEFLKKDEDFFFYHDKRNHFWEILQRVFEPKKTPKMFTSRNEKKDYLNTWDIAMANIIHEFKVSQAESKDPSDKFIFKAYKKGNVKFKKVGGDFSQILETTPLFFTCKEGDEINFLLDGYLEFNRVQKKAQEHVKFLMTPTRCNQIERSLGWKIRMAQFGVKTDSVVVPNDFLT